MNSNLLLIYYFIQLLYIDVQNDNNDGTTELIDRVVTDETR